MFSRITIIKLFLSVCAVTAFTVSGYGQASLSFSGGLGTKLHLTIAQPVAYAVFYNATGTPFFEFSGPADFTESNVALTGTVTFSINNGLPQSIQLLNATGLFSGVTNLFSLSPNFGNITFHPGDYVVLSGGSLDTVTPIAESAPASGSYATYLATNSGTLLAGTGTTVPEPSTWVILLCSLGFLIYRLHRHRIRQA